MTGAPTMFADLRFALRLFSRNPLFTATVVLVLGLSVGASTTVFALVDAYLLKPLPFREPDRLVAIWCTTRPNRDTDSFSAPDLLDVQGRATSLSHVAALRRVSMNLAGTANAPPELVVGNRVSAEYFPALGVSPALGRAFTADEDAPGREQVVVLSDELFRRRFNGDPSTVGRAIMLHDTPYQVIGVMPPAFRAPFNLWSGAGSAEFWVPAALARGSGEAREAGAWLLVGRLAPGASLEAADAEVGAIAKHLEEAYPASNVDKTFYAVSLSEQLASGIRPALTVIFAATLLLLFIASANIALLLLARASARQNEVSVRAALGATGPQLMRQFLVESAVLASLGGLVGFTLCFFGTGLAAAGFRNAGYAPHEARPDARVLLFALLSASVAGLGFGLAPAFRASKTRLSELLKEGAARSTSSARRRRTQSALLVIEVALSAVLLTGSASVARGFYRMLNRPTGFSTERVLTFMLRLPPTRYPKPESVRAFRDGLLARLRALPSVSSAGAATFIPLANWHTDNAFSVEERPAPASMSHAPYAQAQVVNGDYFDALGIALREGRLFTEADGENGAPVVVVDEALARQYFPSESPLGKRIKWWGEGQPSREIVGVVSAVRYNLWEAEPRPVSYVPLAQEKDPPQRAVFVVKAGSPPAALANAAREAVRQLDADVPVVDVKTFDALAAESVADRRFTLWLVSAFAGSALLLTALGLFGLVSYQTKRRSRELAIRMSLGAASNDLIGLIVRDTSRLLFAGLALGLPAAFASGRLLASKLEGVPPVDPLTLSATALVLGLVALVAVLAPARRAARTSPAVVLRDE